MHKDQSNDLKAPQVSPAINFKKMEASELIDTKLVAAKFASSDKEQQNGEITF